MVGPHTPDSFDDDDNNHDNNTKSNGLDLYRAPQGTLYSVYIFISHHIDTGGSESATTSAAS